MIEFLDGPAAGQVLQLRRAPMLLRVVQSRRGAWDALDQLDDEPQATERIYIYRRCVLKPVSKVHVLCSPRKGSGFYWMASYRYLPDQPSDADVRSTAAWQAWAIALLEKE